MASSKKHEVTRPGRVKLRAPSQEDASHGWRDRVATAAYYKSESRGFAAGHELEDWLAAEAEEA